LRVYGRDKKGRFVSRRSLKAKAAYKSRIERRQKARALVVALTKMLNHGITLARPLN
jgi:hypothetical protein